MSEVSVCFASSANLSVAKKQSLALTGRSSYRLRRNDRHARRPRHLAWTDPHLEFGLERHVDEKQIPNLVWVRAG